MGEWISKKYPNGCLTCGTKEKSHIGRGLCSTCYQREDQDAKAPQDIGPPNLSEFPPYDASAYGDRESLLQEPQEFLDQVSGERRPGQTSSVPSQASAPDRKGLRGLFSKKERPTQEEKPTKERAPKVRQGRRVSTADTIEDLWGGLGALAMRTGKHYPLGRYLQFSAGVSSELIDDSIQGTFVDKMLLQPIVKGRGRYDALGAVFGPPLIILAIENDPSKAPILIPILKSSIRNSLPMMAKAIKKVQAKEKANAEAARELFPDLQEGEDPVDGIIAMLFEGWTPPEPPVEAEEEEAQEERVA